MFYELWRHVKQTSHPHRFSSLTFEYEALFEGDEPDEDVEDAEVKTEILDDEAQIPPEQRSSRCTVVDRISEIDRVLSRLQSVYPPFHSITQLRIPASTRGGHHFYFDGRVTNRSDSFVDHRQQIAFVLRLYRAATEAAEETLWMQTEQRHVDAATSYRLHGAPVLLKFSERLQDDVFFRWASAMFSRRSRFRLWGNPIPVGSRQFHVYGVDRHLWQPLYLDFSQTHVTAILPKGTCGNTIHRLVTNIQRYLDPAVKAWIGAEPYEQVLQRSRLKKTA